MCASAMFVNAIQQCYSCVCVCVCVCVCKCNVCECYSAVLFIRLTYTSTKTCMKNEWHDYGEYIYSLSIS